MPEPHGPARVDRVVARRRRGWSRAKTLLTWAFFGLVAWLLVSHAREIEWRDVGQAISALPASTLALAASLSVLGHLVYGCYDLLSRHYVGFNLGTTRVMLTTFVSYVFNLNLGSLVGGLGLRYRLYSRQGLGKGTISRIIAFSMWTNWLGYLALAGVLFVLAPIELPADWALSRASLQLLGAALMALASAYLLACATSRRRQWTVRSHDLELPSLRLAAAQLLMAAANWMLIGAIVWVLLQDRIDYGTTLTVMLVAAVAGVLTHVPAGIGILEAVFVTLLAGRLPASEILGALLVYRAIYYLIPLAVGAVAFLVIEKLGPENSRPAATRGPDQTPASPLASASAGSPASPRHRAHGSGPDAR